MEVRSDRTQDDDYYILTLAGNTRHFGSHQLTDRDTGNSGR